MSTGFERQKHVRRRSKTHGFFDHGDKSLHPKQVRYVDNPDEILARKGCFSSLMESLTPTWELPFRLTIFTILAIPVLAAIAVLITTSGLYGVQQICHREALPQSLGICDFAWTKPPTSILHTTPVGKTPMSTTIDELVALDEISPSLQFLGMPLFVITTNLSTILPALESDLNATKFNSLTSDSLAQSAEKAHQLVEQFSGEDFGFRHESSIWEAHGLADLSSKIEHLRNLTSLDAVSSFSATESFLKNKRLFPGNTLNYELLSQYYNFIKHHLPSIENLAASATETKLALHDLLGHIGKLETKLLKTSHPEHADSLSLMRLSTMWSLQVVQLASEHYKTISASLHSLAAPLEAEVAKHERWWGTFVWKNDVSIERLNAIVTAESGQLSELSAKALRTQDEMDRVFAEYQESEEAQATVRWKLEEAAREGRVEWL
ncbi:hypothetical protein CERZMDRAFT_100435 [Cercospora zeae-maydis SCOH1-5]|uniref:Uncharacterized protein n=1 Tax=Cercospora zeae-maydis SCOH1-5 TaxID=717836 RepID=A0A6A6F7S8_9PEZI|nr:hypothetical protein CERZMDRAFT_100435 [Cercospora zeae-maydis SCOH1-5]